MMFDKMCKAAERDSGCSWLKSSLGYASLVEYGESKNAEWSIDRGPSLFRLPWKAVAIEDSMGCVLLERAGFIDGYRLPAPRTKHEMAWAVGCPEPDEMVRNTTADVGLRCGDVFRFAFAQNTSLHDTSLIVMCRVVFAGTRDDIVDDEGQPFFHYGFSGVRRIILNGGSVDAEDMPQWSPVTHSIEMEALRQIIVATWQCVTITQPGTWIAKECASEVRAEHHRCGKKIARSHQRERYIILTDAERRRYFRESTKHEGGEDRTVTPHARRAHYRHVGQNEDGTKRYTWVRACWVGSTEAEIRGQRYRVELGL